MTEKVKCPVCGSHVDAAVLRDAADLRRAIEVLQGQLRDLEASHPNAEHPAHLYGGYGGEPPPDQEPKSSV
jgi:hypothetical protein